MLWITNGSTPSSLTAGAQIPFDTTVSSTNNNAVRNGNTIAIYQPGWYMTNLNAVLSSTEAATTTVQLYAQGNAVQNAAFTVDIPAAGTATVALNWPIQVINADAGVATVSWQTSSAVTLDCVSAGVEKIV